MVVVVVVVVVVVLVLVVVGQMGPSVDTRANHIIHITSKAKSLTRKPKTPQKKPVLL